MFYGRINEVFSNGVTSLIGPLIVGPIGGPINEVSSRWSNHHNSPWFVGNWNKAMNVKEPFDGLEIYNSEL